MINLPAEISGKRIMDGFRHGRFGGGDVMFVAIAANELKKLLEVRDLDHAIAAESIQLVFGETSLSHIRGDASSKIIGGNPTISKRSGTHLPHDRAIRVFFAYSARDDLLVIHFLLGKKGFRQVRAVEHDSFVRVAVKIIVPVQQRGGAARSSLQNVHPYQPGNVGFTRAG